MANNLTRDEARDRRQLLEVISYQVELDLTGGEETFGSATVVRFRCASPGAASFIELTAPAVREIMLNGTPVPPSAFDGNRITLAGLRADNELRVVAECAYSRSGEGLHRFTDPADGSSYLYSDLETFDAHRIYACFDQPDLKATFEFSVLAPADWLVLSNMAADVPGEAARPGPALALPAIAADVHLHHRGRGRPVFRGPERARRHPAGHLLPPVAGRVPGPGRDLRGDPAGLRLLPRRVRGTVRVRQVRPGVRAGVQGRRDGERGLRDVPGGLRVPLPGDRFRPGDARRDDPARDGAHVVRRPGHHALVGRPVAERVVRHLGVRAGRVRGHPVGQRLDHVLPAAEVLGLPAGPAAVHAPDRGRHPGHRRGRGQLRRHHLRQGRVGAQAAGRLRRPGAVPGRGAALLRPARLGQRDADRPARRAGADLRPGAGRMVQGVAGNRRGEHPAAGLRAGQRRADDRVRGGADRAAGRTRCSARTGSRSACTTGPGPG